MGSRYYSRHGNGRFRRATLENTFGLSAPSCPSCGRLNPHGVNEAPPENCHACGAPMKSEQPEAANETDAGFPVVPPGQIEAEVAEDVRRLLREG